MLRDTEAAPEFVSLGHVSAKQRVRLKAAGVRMVDPDDEAGRMRLLSTAWIYIAPAGGRGVPVEQAYRQPNLATAGSDFTQTRGSVVGN